MLETALLAYETDFIEQLAALLGRPPDCRR